MDVSEIITLISSGENSSVEFRISYQGNIAKDVCSFSNTEGGTIILGVDDNKNIRGMQPESNLEQKVSDQLHSIQPAPKVSYERMVIDQKLLFIVKVDAQPEFLFSIGGHTAYIRVGSNNRPLSIPELIQRAAETRMIYFDSLPSNENIDILSKDLILGYLSEMQRIRGVKVPSESVEEHMKRIQAVTKKGDAFRSTNAGIMAFCREPAKYLPNYKISLTVFSDDLMNDFSDKKEFTANIPDIIEGVLKYLYDKIAIVGGKIVEGKRVEIREYPLEALREAIVNAVAHRNYFDPGDIKINLFPNRIVISNPGSFPPGVTLENPVHRPRNPALSDYLYNLGYVEKYGSGLAKIKRLCDEHPFVSYKYEILPFTTNVEFRKPIEKSKKYLRPIQLAILGMFQTEKILSTGVLLKKFRMARPTMLRLLDELETLGYIQQKGKGRGTHYILLRMPD